MAVITVSRELGSLGTYIARETAQRLQIPLLDKGIIERLLVIAKRFQTQHGDGHLTHYKVRWDMPGGEMIYLYDRVIQAAYRWGSSVMLGRGTFAVLKHSQDILHVRIQAPFALRVKRVMEKEHIADQAEVETLIKESDRVRAGFIRDWYGIEWDTATCFHLVLDTSLITPEQAIEWLCAWYLTGSENRVSPPLTVDTQETDSQLLAIINQELSNLQAQLNRIPT